MEIDGSGYFCKDKASSLGEIFARAGNGDVAVLERYIASNRNINLKDEDGLALIHHAACQGNVAMIQKLWRNGADLNLRDNGSPAWKPVHYAIFHRKIEAEQTLTKLGAEVPIPILRQVMLEKSEDSQIRRNIATPDGARSLIR